MAIRETLLKFCHNNNINLLGLIEELKRHGERLEQLEQEPEYLQKRFINILFDNLISKHMTPDEKRAKKVMLFNELFGKQGARELAYQSTHMKGLPPINFIKDLFGTDLGQSLVKRIEEKYNLKDIERLNNYDQITFVRHVIKHDIGEQFPWWQDRLPVVFAAYLKHGPEKAKRIIYEGLDDEQRGEKVNGMVKALKRNGVDVRKHHVRKLAYDAYDEDQDKTDRFLERMEEYQRRSEQTREGKKEEEKYGETEQKIVKMLTDFMSEEEATHVIEGAKEKVKIAFIKGTDYYTRVKVYEAITHDNKLANLSTQRKAIVTAWVQTWLHITE